MNLEHDVVLEERIPRPIRWLGAKFKDGRSSYRMKWGELSFAKRGWALSLCLFGNDDDISGHRSLHLHLLGVNAFIRLPGRARAPKDMMESWGATGDHELGSIHLNWGSRCKIVHLPWKDWQFFAHEVRRPDGSWADHVGSWEIGENNITGRPPKEPDGRAEETYPYHYMLRSGEVQKVNATISVQRWRHRLRWFPFITRTRTSIDVRFDGEVGERAGSWKGGTIGCGYSLREGETAYECLRRMEYERKFN